jgi:hypothetical protein
MAEDGTSSPPLETLDPSDTEWERWGELVIDILDAY